MFLAYAAVLLYFLIASPFVIYAFSLGSLFYFFNFSNIKLSHAQWFAVFVMLSISIYANHFIFLLLIFIVNIYLSRDNFIPESCKFDNLIFILFILLCLFLYVFECLAVDKNVLSLYLFLLFLVSRLSAYSLMLLFLIFFYLDARLASLSVIILFFLKDLKLFKRRLSTNTIFLLIFSLSVVYFALSAYVYENFNFSLDRAGVFDASNFERFQANSHALFVFNTIDLDVLLLGSSFDLYDNSYSTLPHNDIIQYLLKYGMIFTFCFIYFFSAALSRFNLYFYEILLITINLNVLGGVFLFFGVFFIALLLFSRRSFKFHTKDY